LKGIGIVSAQHIAAGLIRGEPLMNCPSISRKTSGAFLPIAISVTSGLAEWLALGVVSGISPRSAEQKRIRRKKGSALLLITIAKNQ
jgi:hypothetical protein